MVLSCYRCYRCATKCYLVVTELLQEGYRCVTGVVKNIYIFVFDNFVYRCYNIVIFMCYRGVKECLICLQGLYRCVTVVFQECYGGELGWYGVFKECYTNVTDMLQGCYRSFTLL